jgi:hypothetical protein
MTYVLQLPDPETDPSRGSQQFYSAGSGSLLTVPEKSPSDDFSSMVKEQLREILEDLFRRYNSTRCDQTTQGRNMLIRHIYLITRLFNESNSSSKSRSKSNSSSRSQDEASGLLTDELNVLFAECMDRFIGNITDLVQQLESLTDENVRTQLLEMIAESFDESFAPFIKSTGERYA